VDVMGQSFDIQSGKDFMTIYWRCILCPYIFITLYEINSI
jgi:hypothetical protein